MEEIVYIQMKEILEVKKAKVIYLKDIAHIATRSPLQQVLEQQKIYQMTEKDKNVVVLDGFTIIEHLNRHFEPLHIKLLGSMQTIVKIKEEHKKRSFILVLFVWTLLFIGAAMTIMNFHYDVSMHEVQQKMHFIITGQEKERPLLIQIPYSVGLGIGMLLFLNHWFRKKITEEPSPLEIELYNYQQNLDEYLRREEYSSDD